jgi:hypothetical protein
MRADRAQRRVQRQALREGRVNIEQARVQAQLITNPARQQLMLEVIDDLERTRDKLKLKRERNKRLKQREEFIRVNMARLVTDDQGRTWAIARDLPNGATFVDGGGVTWRYNEPERHLMKINDGL